MLEPGVLVLPTPLPGHGCQGAGVLPALGSPNSQLTCPQPMAVVLGTPASPTTPLGLLILGPCMGSWNPYMAGFKLCFETQPSQGYGNSWVSFMNQNKMVRRPCVVTTVQPDMGVAMQS